MVDQKLSETGEMLSSIPTMAPAVGVLTDGYGSRNDPITGTQGLPSRVRYLGPPWDPRLCSRRRSGGLHRSQRRPRQDRPYLARVRFHDNVRSSQRDHSPNSVRRSTAAKRSVPSATRADQPVRTSTTRSTRTASRSIRCITFSIDSRFHVIRKTPPARLSVRAAFSG